MPSDASWCPRKAPVTVSCIEIVTFWGCCSSLPGCWLSLFSFYLDQGDRIQSAVLDVSLIQRYMLSTGNHIKIYISFIHHNLTQACRFVSFFGLCLGAVLGLGISALWNTEKWSDSCREGCAPMEQLQEELWGSEQRFGHLVCSCHWKLMRWVNYRFEDVQYRT